MVNVTVFKLRDLIKQGLTLIVLLMLIYFVIKFLGSIKEKNDVETYAKSKVSQMADSFNETLKNSLSKTIPVMSLGENNNIQDAEEEESFKEDYYKKLLSDEIAAMGAIDSKATDSDDTQIKNEEQQPDQKDQIQLAGTNVATEVVTPNPIKENFNTTYGNVKIKNETDYNLTDEMLTPDITIDNKKVLIFHTHTCESYTASDAYPYTPTGSYRTTDLGFTVSKVGDELTKYLQEYKIDVTHDTTYHDYPSYNGSYTRSLETVENITNQNPTDIVIDLHRDAIGSRSDYAPTVKIGDNDYAAQIMFVVGTNNGGLYHPNWNQNLKFAVKIQEKAEEMYPGLFKPIMLTKSRYNQHATKYATIIEVGATGNTLEQCMTSMKYLSKVMQEVIQP